MTLGLSEELSRFRWIICIINNRRSFVSCRLPESCRFWRENRREETKCKLGLFLNSELLPLSSIHHVSHRTGSDTELHLFLRRGQISVSSLWHVFQKKPPGTLHLSWRRQGRHLTAASTVQTWFFFFSLLNYMPVFNSVSLNIFNTTEIPHCKIKL